MPDNITTPQPSADQPPAAVPTPVQPQPAAEVAPISKQKHVSPTKALTKLREEREQKHKRDVSLGHMLNLYLVPIVVLVVFGATLFVLIIPGISRIFAQLGQIQRTEEVAQRLDDQLQRLQELTNSSTQIQGDINAISAIIPEGQTEVVRFQQSIRQLAQSRGLNVIEATTGEQVLTTTVDEDNTDESLRVLSIVEIPSTFTVSGTLPLIRQFIESIKQLDDFVIIGEMELNTSQEFSASQLNAVNQGEWTLTIVLIKYQFQVPNEANQLREVYTRVPESAQLSQRVLDYVRAKTSTLNLQGN